MKESFNYLLVGDGRLAHHLNYYFRQLNISFETWSRRTDTFEDLGQKADKANRILLLISDASIESFVDKHLKKYFSELNRGKLLIHCSGALVSKSIIGVHPLQSFTKDSLYSLSEYQKICFFYDKNNYDLSFQDIFPELTNPNFVIEVEKKALYHAFCVGANNFTTILWQTFAQRMNDEFNVPFDELKYYMQTTFKNIDNNIEKALTGPFVRNDQKTINSNRDSLANDNFKVLYEAFLNFYNLEKSK